MIQSGTYSVTVTSRCEENFESEDVLFEVNIVEQPIVEGDTLLEPGKATLNSNFLSTHWYEEGGELIGSGSEFVTDSLYETTVFQGAAIEESYNRYGRLGLTTIPTIINYSNYAKVRVRFNVIEHILLKSVKVLTDTAGTRDIMILKEGDIVFEKAIDIPIGESLLELDVQLSPGQYSIRAGISNNTPGFNDWIPYFTTSQGDQISYPYTLSDAISITGNNRDASSYYYFYDWDISYDFHSCESERVPVTVVVKPVSTTDYDLVPMSIYPNPNTGYFTVYLASGALQSMRLYDHRGSMIYTKELRGGQSEITVDLELSSGIYLVDVITTEGDRVQKKLVVIE